MSTPNPVPTGLAADEAKALTLLGKIKTYGAKYGPYVVALVVGYFLGKVV
jgi:hypothetical protein